jgi:hypothetical protein
MLANPCPGGPDEGSTRRCRGYIIDHVCPLVCCGLDAPQNLQWQPRAEAKAKDARERDCSNCEPNEPDLDLRAPGILIGIFDRKNEPPDSPVGLLRAAIRAHAPEVIACYETYLKDHPGVEGKVVLAWVIEPDGHVSKAKVRRAETSFPGEEVPACMIARLLTWEFPRRVGVGATIVTYPWTLRTASTEGEPARPPP